MNCPPVPAPDAPLHAIVAALLQDGFVCLAARQTFDLIGGEDNVDWSSFARSWDDLGEDLYMADGGRYRRRRYAAFMLDDADFVRKPHQAHYQSRDYNPLNGDVQRWFAPITAATVAMPALQAIFATCARLLAEATGSSPGCPWNVEVHQFRTETTPDHIGRPTPEGLHRDGVDWAFVLLVRRENVREGVTHIGAPDGESLGSFLLKDPGDAVLLDDRRVLHGVTEIEAIDPARPAYRDVLVITFAQ